MCSSLPPSRPPAHEEGTTLFSPQSTIHQQIQLPLPSLVWNDQLTTHERIPSLISLYDCTITLFPLYANAVFLTMSLWYQRYSYHFVITENTKEAKLHHFSTLLRKDIHYTNITFPFAIYMVLIRYCILRKTRNTKPVTALIHEIEKR